MFFDPTCPQKPEPEKKPDAGLGRWRDLLLRSADLMERRGMAKRIQEDPDTKTVCLIGAISIAEYGEPYQVVLSRVGSVADYAVIKLYEHLTREGIVSANRGAVGCWDRDLEAAFICAWWNNEPRTTLADVTGAMRAAAGA